MRRARESKPPPYGWSAYVATLGEEVSSKYFYRKFKAKHAKAEVGSLFKVEDWNQPNLGNGEVSSNQQIAEGMAGYYKWLYRRKKLCPNQLAYFSKYLASKKVPPKLAKEIDKEVTEKEVRGIIRKLGKGKACGPDRLPAEFYQDFEHLLAPTLTTLLNDAADNGLPASFLQGEIITLYKKGDPRDPRNYRPITILNADYKTFTKLLAHRLNRTLDSIISPQQLGFVPGRIITEASHLV